jgi:U3 small nucleolar ribonucleoprotein component
MNIIEYPMTEALPISIHPSAELIDNFVKIKSVTNKLEAQFNFHTLTAGWFGEEEDIIFIELYLETPTDFAFQKTQEMLGDIDDFADDVMSCYQQQQHKIQCYIAITEVEQALLLQKKRLLAGYVQAKIRKVLNLIADKLNLVSI